MISDNRALHPFQVATPCPHGMHNCKQFLFPNVVVTLSRSTFKCNGTTILQQNCTNPKTTCISNHLKRLAEVWLRQDRHTPQSFLGLVKCFLANLRPLPLRRLAQQEVERPYQIAITLVNMASLNFLMAPKFSQGDTRQSYLASSAPFGTKSNSLLSPAGPELLHAPSIAIVHAEMVVQQQHEHKHDGASLCLAKCLVHMPSQGHELCS